MSTPFRHVALFGKYQAQGVRPILEEIAQFLVRGGVEVSVDHDTAMNSDWLDYGAMRIDADPVGGHAVRPYPPASQRAVRGDAASGVADDEMMTRRERRRR